MAISGNILIIVVAAIAGGTILLLGLSAFTYLWYRHHGRQKACGMKEINDCLPIDREYVDASVSFSTPSPRTRWFRNILKKDPKVETAQKELPVEITYRPSRRVLTKKPRTKRSPLVRESDVADQELVTDFPRQHLLDDKHRAGLKQLQWVDVARAAPLPATRRSSSYNTVIEHVYLAHDRMLNQRECQSPLSAKTLNFSLKRSFSDGPIGLPPSVSLPQPPMTTVPYESAVPETPKHRSAESIGSSILGSALSYHRKTKATDLSRQVTAKGFTRLRSEAIAESQRQERQQEPLKTDTKEESTTVQNGEAPPSAIAKSDLQPHQPSDASVLGPNENSCRTSGRHSQLIREESSSLSVSLTNKSFTPLALKFQRELDKQRQLEREQASSSPSEQKKARAHASLYRGAAAENRLANYRSSVLIDETKHSKGRTQSLQDLLSNPGWGFTLISPASKREKTRSFDKDSLQGRPNGTTIAFLYGKPDCLDNGMDASSSRSSALFRCEIIDQPSFTVDNQAPRFGSNCLPPSSSVFSLTSDHLPTKGDGSSKPLVDSPDITKMPAPLETQCSRRAHPLDPPELLFPSPTNTTCSPFPPQSKDKSVSHGLAEIPMPRFERLNPPVSVTADDPSIAPQLPRKDFSEPSSRVLVGPRPVPPRFSSIARSTKRASTLLSGAGSSEIPDFLSTELFGDTRAQSSISMSHSPRMGHMASALRRKDSLCEAIEPSYFALVTTRTASVPTSDRILSPSSRSPSPRLLPSPVYRTREEAPAEQQRKKQQQQQQQQQSRPERYPHLISALRSKAEPLMPVSGNETAAAATGAGKGHSGTHLQAYPRWATGRETAALPEGNPEQEEAHSARVPIGLGITCVDDAALGTAPDCCGDIHPALRPNHRHRYSIPPSSADRSSPETQISPTRRGPADAPIGPLERFAESQLPHSSSDRRDIDGLDVRSYRRAGAAGAGKDLQYSSPPQDVVDEADTSTAKETVLRPAVFRAEHEHEKKKAKRKKSVRWSADGDSEEKDERKGPEVIVISDSDSEPETLVDVPEYPDDSQRAAGESETEPAPAAASIDTSATAEPAATKAAVAGYTSLLPSWARELRDSLALLRTPSPECAIGQALRSGGWDDDEKLWARDGKNAVQRNGGNDVKKGGGGGGEFVVLPLRISKIGYGDDLADGKSRAGVSGEKESRRGAGRVDGALAGAGMPRALGDGRDLVMEKTEGSRVDLSPGTIWAKEVF